MWLDPQKTVHHREYSLGAFLGVEGAFDNVKNATIEKLLVELTINPPEEQLGALHKEESSMAENKHELRKEYKHCRNNMKHIELKPVHTIRYSVPLTGQLCIHNKGCLKYLIQVPPAGICPVRS